MNTYLTYGIIFVILLALELVYFKGILFKRFDNHVFGHITPHSLYRIWTFIYNIQCSLIVRFITALDIFKISVSNSDTQLFRI